MTETRAMTQDIRPLHILLLNLMPTKIDTETQLSRLLGNTPLQVELDADAQVSTHESKNTPEEHLLAFYKNFDDVAHLNFDGMIITGAPVEHLPFEAGGLLARAVPTSWTGARRTSTARSTSAGARRRRCTITTAFEKQPLPEKMFGVFPHHGGV